MLMEARKKKGGITFSAVVLYQLKWTMKLNCQTSLIVIPGAVTSTSIPLPTEPISTTGTF